MLFRQVENILPPRFHALRGHRRDRKDRRGIGRRQAQQISQGRLALQHGGVGGNLAGAKVGQGAAGLGHVAGVSGACLEKRLGAIERILPLAHLLAPGPGVDPRLDQGPIALDGPADRLLEAVLELEERPLGVDPGDDDRSLVDADPGALQ